VAGPSVSVVLCTFNGRQYVARQLDSVLRQTHLPDEIVLADDGSSDQTLEIAAEQIASAALPQRPRLTVLDVADCLGVTRNFSRAIEASSSDIVFLSDQDDVWREDKIEQQLFDLEREPTALLSVSNARLIGSGGDALGMDLFSALRITARDLRSVTGGQPASWLVRRSVFPGMTFAMRRQLLKWALPIPTTWPHDYWLSLIAASLGPIKVSSECLVDYRQHPSNVVGVVSHTLPYRVRRVFRSEMTSELYRSRFASMLERLTAVPEADQAALAAVEGKLRFEERRASFHANRFRRSLQICALTTVGSYSRYASNGTANGVRDALSAGRT